MSINITDNTDEVLEALKRAINIGLEEIGGLVEGDAALQLENEPRRVDTGNLRDSITHEVHGKSVDIGTNVSYAGYVHDGTSKMAPNRFLVNAAENDREDITAIMERALSNG